MHFQFVGVGCGPDGKKRRFQIMCRGEPMAGFDTLEAANRAWASYTGDRPKMSYTFTLVDDGLVIRTATSEVRKPVSRGK